MKYARLHGDLYWLDSSDRPLFASSSIAVAFDADTGTLLKHGPPDRVAAWVADARRKQAEAGLELFTHISTVESREWDVVDLNAIVSRSMHVGEFVRRQLAGQPKELDAT